MEESAKIAKAFPSPGDVLFCDVGNCRLKWFFADRYGVVVHNHNWLSCCDAIAAQLGERANDMQRVRVNLRPTHRFYPALIQTMRQSFSVSVEGMSVCGLESDPVRLSVAYTDLDQLGCDRWCALLAARYRFDSGLTVVVDSGSAITVDIVLDDGRHLGGYIVPGLASMMEECTRLTGINSPAALFERTDHTMIPGRNSLDCIRHGIALFVCSYLEKIWENAIDLVAEQSLMGARSPSSDTDPADPARLVLTGGDSRWLGDALAHLPITVVPDLVLEGMRLADTISPAHH